MLSTTNPDSQRDLPIDPQIDSITLKTDDLLRDLLATDRSLLEVAAAHKLTVRQLIAWCRQPAVRAFLDDADELALRRAAHKAAQARQLAITVLTEHCQALCETTRDRDHAGKAARTLLRTSVARPTHTPHSEPSSAGRRTPTPTSRSRLSDLTDTFPDLAASNGSSSHPPISPPPLSPSSPPLRFRVFNFKPAQSICPSLGLNPSRTPATNITPNFEPAGHPNNNGHPPTTPRSASP